MSKKEKEKMLYEAYDAYKKHREGLYLLSVGNDETKLRNTDKGLELARELERVLDFVSYSLD